jgi:S-DNA-T family DNA segregation ATPase FtsK/SpoIIIE
MPYLTTATEIQAAISHLSTSSILWLDTEVADWWMPAPRLSLIQVLADAQDLTGESVWLLDVLDRPHLVQLFINQIMVDPGIEKVFHNASYDLKFLGSTSARNVTCTLKLAKQFPKHTGSIVPIMLI